MHRRITTRLLALVVVALLLTTVARPVGGVRAAAPALALGTDTLACDAPDLTVAVRGGGFTPGAIIALGAAFINQSGRPPEYVIAGKTTADADGAFIVRLQLRGVIYCPTNVGGQYAAGLPFSVGAFAGIPEAQTADQPLATAGLTVTALDTLCEFASPYCIAGRFLSYWQKHGGLARFGVPLSGEGRERLEDGQSYVVQYFERARLELHPELPVGNDVLLGQIGRHFHPADPPATPLPDARYFPETGHNLHTGFRDYWEERGGLAAFGYPLSEEFTERLEDGNEYTVQYFERARFEWHPENPTPYRVLLGQLGRSLQSPLIWHPANSRITTAPAQP